MSVLERAAERRRRDQAWRLDRDRFNAACRRIRLGVLDADKRLHMPRLLAAERVPGRVVLRIIMPSQIDSRQYERWAARLAHAYGYPRHDPVRDLDGTLLLTLYTRTPTGAPPLLPPGAEHVIRVGHDARTGDVRDWHVRGKWSKPHLLVTGVSESGKSSTLRRLIVGTAESVDVVVLDPKEVESGILEPAGRLVAVARTAKDIDALLAVIVEDVDARYSLMRRHAATHWTLVPAEERPRQRVIIFDEYTQVTRFAAGDKNRGLAAQRVARTQERVAIIADKARASGVHLVLGVHRPDAELLGSGMVRDNFTARLAHGLLAPVAASMMFGPGDATLAAAMAPVETGRVWSVGLSDAPATPSPVRVAFVDGYEPVRRALACG